MRMGLVPGRGGILSSSPRPSLRSAAQTASFPTPPSQSAMTAGAPPRSRRNPLGPCCASALAASLTQLGGLSYLNLECSPPTTPSPSAGGTSVLGASLARLGGLSYLNLGVAGRRKASRYYFDYRDY